MTSRRKHVTYKRAVKERWTPPLGWVKRNTDASRIDGQKSTTTDIVRRNDHGRIRFQSGKFIDDCPTLMTETLAIRETIMESIRAKFSNLMIDSDFQVAIRAILGDIKAPSITFNIVEDICIWLQLLEISSFYIVIDKLNTLTDSLVKSKSL